MRHIRGSRRYFDRLSLGIFLGRLCGDDDGPDDLDIHSPPFGLVSSEWWRLFTNTEQGLSEADLNIHGIRPIYETAEEEAMAYFFGEGDEYGFGAKPEPRPDPEADKRRIALKIANIHKAEERERRRVERRNARFTKLGLPIPE